MMVVRRDSSGARIRGPSCSIPAAHAIRHGLWDYIKENKDYPYYLVRDRFAGAEGKSLRSVQRGEGKVIESQRPEGRRVSRRSTAR